MTTIFQRRGNSTLILISLCFLIIGFLGCSKKKVVPSNRAIVTGTVTIAGQKLKGGSVTIATKADERMRANQFINKEGIYKVKDAPIGDCFIKIETESLLAGPKHLYVKIPGRYERFKTSGLEIDVKPGENKKDLVLTSDPKK